MTKTLSGLLSGKYDSTKQRTVLLNGDRLRNYRSFTATIRIELLLTGRMIFTDAQFFDGLYFHWLAKNLNELQAFEKLLVPFADTQNGGETPFSISVKCRSSELDERHGHQNEPNLDYVAIKTFCKEFRFSSIEDDRLVEAIFELGHNFVEEYVADDLGRRRICPPNTNLEDYISAIDRQLKSLYGETSSSVESWTNYANELRTLFSIKYVDKWGYRNSDGKWSIPQWDVLMNKCLTQEIPGEPKQSYLAKMKDLMDRAKGSEGMDNNPVANRYFAQIRGELNTGIGNRSKITMALDALEHLNNDVATMEEDEEHRKHCEYASNCFRDFRQLLNDRYNKVLACQHGCKFLDLCDYTKIYDLAIEKKADMRSLSIPKKLIENLAELSWLDFWELLDKNRGNLETAFYKWMDLYDSFSFSSSKIGDLINELEQYFVELVSVFVNTKFNSNAISTNTGPWNIEGTCNDDIRNIFAQFYPSPYYLVGGGSFEPGEGALKTEYEKGIAGNEICILCIKKKMTGQEKVSVLRLQLKEMSAEMETLDEDCNFNTLLSPVCNLLNGGNCEH